MPKKKLGGNGVPSYLVMIENRLATMETTVGDMKDSVSKNLFALEKSVTKITDDHEKRLRTNEKNIYLASGAIIAIISILQVLNYIGVIQ